MTTLPTPRKLISHGEGIPHMTLRLTPECVEKDNVLPQDGKDAIADKMPLSGVKPHHERPKDTLNVYRFRPELMEEKYLQCLHDPRASLHASIIDWIAHTFLLKETGSEVIAIPTAFGKYFEELGNVDERQVLSSTFVLQRISTLAGNEWSPVRGVSWIPIDVKK